MSDNQRVKYSFKILVSAHENAKTEDLVEWFSRRIGTIYEREFQNITVKQLDIRKLEISFESPTRLANIYLQSTVEIMADPDDDCNYPLHQESVMGYFEEGSEIDIEYI